MGERRKYPAATIGRMRALLERLEGVYGPRRKVEMIVIVRGPKDQRPDFLPPLPSGDGVLVALPPPGIGETAETEQAAEEMKLELNLESTKRQMARLEAELRKKRAAGKSVEDLEYGDGVEGLEEGSEPGDGQESGSFDFEKAMRDAFGELADGDDDDSGVDEPEG